MTRNSGALTQDRQPFHPNLMPALAVFLIIRVLLVCAFHFMSGVDAGSGEESPVPVSVAV
jgi:hypothetical protein